MSNCEPFSVIEYQFLELKRKAPLLLFICSKVQAEIRFIFQCVTSVKATDCERKATDCERKSPLTATR